jgi:uncharacterized membrane protein
MIMMMVIMMMVIMMMVIMMMIIMMIMMMMMMKRMKNNTHTFVPSERNAPNHIEACAFECSEETGNR